MLVHSFSFCDGQGDVEIVVKKTKLSIDSAEFVVDRIEGTRLGYGRLVFTCYVRLGGELHVARVFDVSDSVSYVPLEFYNKVCRIS